MSVSSDMLRALEAGDIAAARTLFASAFPHLPQPSNRSEAAVIFHMARTATVSVRFNLRAYSHAWLMERGLPSQLPEHVWPAAQRIYPIIREGVGIVVKTNNPHRKEFAKGLQQALVDTVAEMYADGDRDPEMVKARMAQVRLDFYRRN